MSNVAAAPTAQAAPVSLLRNLAAAPFIYLVLAPLVLLDAVASLYQSVCFRLWRIPRVRRSLYLKLDRHKLAYLTPLQKLNCIYCSYANGILAYLVELAARTEQFWCPIQHAETPVLPHGRYADFIPFGEAAGLEARWRDMRSRLQDEART